MLLLLFYPAIRFFSVDHPDPRLLLRRLDLHLTHLTWVEVTLVGFLDVAENWLDFCEDVVFLFGELYARGGIVGGGGGGGGGVLLGLGDAVVKHTDVEFYAEPGQLAVHSQGLGDVAGFDGKGEGFQQFFVFYLCHKYYTDYINLASIYTSIHPSIHHPSLTPHPPTFPTHSLNTIRTHIIITLTTMPQPIIITHPTLLTRVAAVAIRVVLRIDFLNYRWGLTQRSTIFTRKCFLSQMRQ